MSYYYYRGPLLTPDFWLGVALGAAVALIIVGAF